MIAGLSATVATERGAISEGWTDGTAIAEQLHDEWYAYEGTIRATDMEAHLDLEDELASMRRALDAGDQAGLATATAGFESLARQYTVEHPG